MTDDQVRTVVETDAGLLDFQQYFVRESCEPVVRSLQFQGAGQAKAAEGALEALENADVVVICPSNPWLSVDPILAVPDLHTAISRKPCYAVSPIIGGESVRGPAAKIYRELGFEPSPMAVAVHYEEFLTGMVIDLVDQAYHPQIVGMGMHCLVAQTLMKTRPDRLKLAEEVLSFMREQEGF
jgi:LPPG:FO 2-phospho-L-lactate transferase